MKPYYEHGGIAIYLGDCREILPCIQQPPACVTDPVWPNSVLAAAKHLNQSCIGIEIEERFCEIAAKRLSQEVFAFEAVA
jgi:hypothetical protein